MRTVCPWRGIIARALLSVAGLGAVGFGVQPLGAQAVDPERSTGRHLVSVSGVVRERQTDAALADASVEMTSVGASNPTATALTDRGGEFNMKPVPGGDYVVRVTRLGYKEIQDTIDLAEGPPARLTVYLTPEAIDLPPMLVMVEQGTPPKMQGFERRRAQGIGTFLTRAEIEKRHAARVTDLFRSVPGVRIVPSAQTGDGILTMRGGCRPALVIDGTPIYGGISLDMTMTPQDVEGIEVYGLAGTPIEYSRSQCGTIMVWTRAPTRVSGRGHPWKLLAVIGGVIATLIVIH
ncbi:MAG: Plug and carboxypeptidase regulatory-like domain-containing protein [Gemmatimonadetes bacterium]|nr:Plug and carboxypeptidase regulatory-like domain-containing protein [Gemmatimonadota bacterium]